ncbi:M16 family metallopeptidase [Clostridium sp.]|uniref:M16 family metallopeptidase n=1 Tax=Clostridium sp. TaxID=1506 RepID=UPI003F40EC8A
MKDCILNNGLRLIYKKSTSDLTSISISIDAGAATDGDKLGIAHATEHMVYKGTLKRSESEINKELSEVFGFQNAMTNYPYVIYYGTLLSSDFELGIELFSDIILNPTFKAEGFKEEMDVIIEELNEWDEEVEQLCEDKLFYNAFNDIRIKHPIIGTKETLKNISLEDIKEFYNKRYIPSNSSIAIVTALEFEEVVNIVSSYFNKWKTSSENKTLEKIETLKEGYYEDHREGINTVKVEMIFPISDLNKDEIVKLRIFNEYFGEGVNSILYDTLRTKNGLIYDVITKIAYEKHINLYKITFSTSNENLNKSISLVKDCINKLYKNELGINEDEIKKYIKTLKLKRLFREEQSIIIAKELSTYNTMFGDYKVYSDEFNGIENFKANEIMEVAKKILKSSAIQVIKNKEGKEE